MKSNSSVQKTISQLENELSQRKSDQQNILLERLRDKDRAEVYTQMLEQCEDDIERISSRINELNNIDDTIKKRKTEIKSSIEALDKIIEEGAISDSDLRMLVESIEISETNGKLDIRVTLNGKFTNHIDNYDSEMIA